jgi:hypothetical protein
MVFVGFGLLFRRLSTLLLAGLAIGFSVAVEFSQLCHAPWIEALRATLPGKLILGSTFNWPDFPAYALGVALGACAEVMSKKEWATR